MKILFFEWVENKNANKITLPKDEFIIKDLNILSYKVASISSLIQERNLINNSKPYFDNVKVNTGIKIEDDKWEFATSLDNSYKFQEEEIEIEGTEKIIQCHNCSGRQKSICESCFGKKIKKCMVCNGSKQVKCNKCDGEAKIACRWCSELGRFLANPKTVSECKHCFAKGYITCKDCQQGMNFCSDCFGKGYNECHNCQGEGKVDCEACYGKGKLISYGAIEIKNYVSSEKKEIYSEGLSESFIKFFKTKYQVNEDNMKDEIDGENITYDHVPLTNYLGQENEIKELFNKHYDVVKIFLEEKNVRRVGMLFGTLLISNIFKYKYDFRGDSYELYLWPEQNIFFAIRNPWNKAINNIENEIIEISETKSRKYTLEKIKYANSIGVDSLAVKNCKKKILDYYLGREILVFIFLLIVSFIIAPHMLRKVELTGEESLDIYLKLLGALLFLGGFIIYNRHKSRQK